MELNRVANINFDVNHLLVDSQSVWFQKPDVDDIESAVQNWSSAFKEGDVYCLNGSGTRSNCFQNLSYWCFADKFIQTDHSNHVGYKEVRCRDFLSKD